MKLNKDMNILIVGLGLIGGSYAMALTRKGYHVDAIDLSSHAINYARQNHMIRYGTTEVEAELVKDADLIVFALYPRVFMNWIAEYQHLFHPGTILTDVTGVKGLVVYDVQAMLRPDVEFIAAHPMAGRESSGIEYSSDTIFQHANYIVVPTEKNSPDAIELCHSLGEELGFRRVTSLSPEEHDEIIAFLSQLTHCIAVSLMCTSDNPHLAEYTGDSFRDLTRIAKINEVMWSELFLLNKPALLKEMDAFIAEITRFREMLERDDAEGMKEKMRCSTERRLLFDKK